MPVIRFRDFAIHPKPTKAYCDSSFIIGLLHFQLNRTTPALRYKDRLCNEFWQDLTTSGVELVGSVLTFHEVLHYYTFHYPSNGFYSIAETFLATREPTFTGGPAKKFKRFLQNYPADCKSAWSTIKYRVGFTLKLFTVLHVKLAYPQQTLAMMDRTPDIAGLAARVKRQYEGLEATDSMHVALAAYLRAGAIVTTDYAFEALHGMKIYLP